MTAAATLTLADEALAYNKPTNAAAPFNAKVDLVYSASDLTDGDGICYDKTNDGGCDSFTFSGIGATQQRYGRLLLQKRLRSGNFAAGHPGPGRIFQWDGF